ncbi:MAG: hypothetical protein OEZ13_11095 [Spirochaetia bacterium]|nr:hypothetical protein [Spirochaetia bacterium]
MSPVKFVHVLKRLEVLDRDIEELRRIEASLEKGRTYSASLNISLELQINHLLNERVKLMELRIENPPEHLIPSMKEIEEPSRKLAEIRSSFTFADLEQDYLDNLMKKNYAEHNKISIGSKTDNMNSKIDEDILEQEDVDILINQYNQEHYENKKNLPATRRIKSFELPNAQKEKNISSKERAEILKNLPTIDY